MRTNGREVRAVARTEAEPGPIRCQACRLKFSALGYRLHRWTDAQGVEHCVPRAELERCFGMHAWERTPDWWSLWSDWESRSRRELVSSLEAGTVSIWQLRTVRLWTQGPTLLDMVRVLLDRNGAAFLAANADGGPGTDGNGP